MYISPPPSLFLCVWEISRICGGRLGNELEFFCYSDRLVCSLLFSIFKVFVLQGQKVNQIYYCEVLEILIKGTKCHVRLEVVDYWMLHNNNTLLSHRIFFEQVFNHFCSNEVPPYFPNHIRFDHFLFTETNFFITI